MYADDIRKELKEQGYDPRFIKDLTSQRVIERLAKAVRDNDNNLIADINKEISDQYQDFKKFTSKNDGSF